MNNMKQIKRLSALVVGCCAALLPVAAQDIPVYLDDSQPIEKRVQDALSRMTLEEKVRLSYAQGKFSSPGCPRLGIPELWMSDGPHGVRAEINWNDWGYAKWNNDSVTAFPALTCLAATWNPDLAMRYGVAVGEEARYRKKDMLLGPGVNIYRVPLNGRNFEYLGEDPYLAAEMCVPYIKGVQTNGVSACVKHFALNNQELWRGHIDIHLSDRALYEIYLPAFKAAVTRGGVWSVMSAYNKVRGVYCSNNKLLNVDILKGEFGFDGCLVTDWGSCHTTYESAIYGLDLEMGTKTDGLTSDAGIPYNHYYLGDEYLRLIKEGRIPMSIVDDKASRMLRLLFRTVMNRQRPYGCLATADHYQVARDVATEGIVLLRNESDKQGDKLLPLREGRYKKILVVGDNATRSLTQGGGSSELKPKNEYSPLEAIRQHYGAEVVTYAQGYAAGRPHYGKVHPVPQERMDSLRADALRKAADADLIIFVGGLNKNHQQDCEAGDRVIYGLPFGQSELIEGLIATRKPMVAVIVSGNAIGMPWLKEVPAVVQSWYLGTMSGPALVDILSGAVNPSGKLPFSYPAKLTDCPAIVMGAISYPGDSVREEYKEDILVGYRWYDTKKIKTQFPFGYGLSYTTFQYSDPRLSGKTLTADGTLEVSLKVKNTGRVAGKETVQLYIGDEKCSLPRPLKELKGFRKISLNPGEEREVRFTVTPEELKFFDDARHAWVAEPGTFRLYLAASAEDVRHTLRFEYRP